MENLENNTCSCCTNCAEKLPESITNFLIDLEKLCKTYGISIAHEDCHGGFILENYSDITMTRLKNAELEFTQDIKPYEEPKTKSELIEEMFSKK